MRLLQPQPNRLCHLLKLVLVRLAHLLLVFPNNHCGLLNLAVLRIKALSDKGAFHIKTLNGKESKDYNIVAATDSSRDSWIEAITQAMVW